MNKLRLLQSYRKKVSITLFLAVASSLVSFAEPSNSGSGMQTEIISYTAQDKDIKTIFKEITDLTGYTFIYDAYVVSGIKLISVNFSNKNIQQILAELSRLTNLSFKITDKTVAVSSRTTTALSEQKTDSQSLTGIVTDQSSQPVIGATIVVVGTTNSALADVNGAFMIKIPIGATIEVSFLGYKPFTMKYEGQKTVNITLEEDVQQLDEVVVIGYGTVRKSDLTGSVGVLKSKVIESQPVTRIDQALQGRISGVQVTTASGAPGATSSIRIRGGNSINAGNEPLYVIDGIIGGGDLSSLNPADVESIEVLRDASSTAIYGSRGANGVIMVTTKRGKGAGRPTLRYNGFIGVQTPAKRIDMLNTQEFMAYQNEKALYMGTKPEMMPYPVAEQGKWADTDWFSQSYRPLAMMTDHSLSLSNSNDNMNYFLSMNYLNQDGIMYKSNFTRYQLRFNVDQKIGSAFQMGATLTMSYTDIDNGRVGGMTYLPTNPVYDETGKYFSYNELSGAEYNNPQAMRDLISDNTNNLRGLGNVYGQLTFLDNLVIKSSFGFDASRSKHNQYESVNLPSRLYNKTGGYAAIKTGFPMTFQNENTVSYHKTLGDHFISAVAGFTAQQYSYENLDVSASGFLNDATLYNAMQTSDPVTRAITTGESKWGLLSGLFRANYSYKNKLLATVSGRYDGSSRLASDRQWAFFPSAALSWRMIEESWIRDLNVFSNLKLRATYGVTGSQGIDPYSIMSRLNSGKNYIGGQEVVTFIPGSSANKNLSWEKTAQYDVGLEMGFLDSRLNIEMEYYYKKTTDLLLSREIPFQSGFQSILENVGSIQNQGFEIAINSVNIRNQNFEWSSTLNLSLNRNKVLDLGGKDFIDNGVGQRLIVGEPVGTFFGSKYLGTWKEGEIPEKWIKVYHPGDVKQADLDDNGVINVNDGMIIGNAEPLFYGGLNNDLRWKNFTLGIFFDFSVGNDIYDLAGAGYEHGHMANVYGHNRDRWTPENNMSDIPRAGSVFRKIYEIWPGGQSGSGGSDFFLHDGSFLRLRNVNLEYAIPFKSNSVFKGLSVYVAATNLFTITNYPGMSPDVNSTGTHATRRGFDSNGYPVARTYTFGIKAQF